ncbi:hypothetical protein PVAND_003175 [Polypedilum vanderplanki]|uniref:Uncharacterized protein n=1 Tax=Polypedilum vanderplanki TaxID=319348 RepID=A0A9J6BU62_POLVA|nr:hypothetical protein PVAND_003175 [Polypedilum vanderplanki]
MAKFDLVDDNADFDIFNCINDDFLIEGISYIDNNNANMERSSTPIAGTSKSFSNSVDEQKSFLMEYKMEEFDPYLVELEEVMSNSLDENHSNLISKTLSGIPLIEVDANTNSIPKTELMLIKAPENVDDKMLEKLPSLLLKKSTLKAIDKASESVDGVVIPTLLLTEYAKPVRRAPLSVVQPIIQCTIEHGNKQASKTENKGKKLRKRKQSFVFPREDGLIFLSDAETSPKRA